MWIVWLCVGIVLGVAFDEFFSKIFKRGREKVKEIAQDMKDD